MKLLLDENLPKKLLYDFPEHEVYTVSYKQWNGVKNGELLKLMVSENFDALLTFDKNMEYQQNFKKYTIAVLVFSAPSNSYLCLKEYVPMLKKLLQQPLAIGATKIE